MRVISWRDLKSESVQLTANGPVFNQHVAPVGVLMWEQSSMELAKGVAQVMDPVLVSRVTVVMA